MSGYAWAVLAIAALLRVLIPFDFALTSIIDDIIVAHEVTHDAQHGFSYFALVMRLVLWIFAATSCYKLLGMELGSSVLTAWGFVRTQSACQTAMWPPPNAHAAKPPPRSPSRGLPSRACRSALV